MTDSDTLKGLVEVNASLKRLVEAVQNKFLLPGPSRLDEKARTLQLSQFLVSDGRARVAALERIAGPQPEAPPAERQRPPLQKAIFEFVKDQWPNGNIPRTAKVRRRMAESEVWKCIAAKHGISTKKTPDWHTVNRALDREV